MLLFADILSVSRPIEFNRNRLHAFLFYRADSRGIIAINQLALAYETGISQFHFNRIIQDFTEEGRIQRIGIPIKHRKLQTFTVSNPVDFLRTRHDDRGVIEAELAMEILRGSDMKRPQTTPNKELLKLVHRRPPQVEEYQT